MRNKNRIRSAYNLKYKPRKSQIRSVEVVEGEPIEHKVRRMLKNGEPITDGAPDIFTERKAGVIGGYDIRTDRWEIATEAMDKVVGSRLATKEDKAKVIKLDTDKDKEVGEAKSIDGKQPENG